MKIPDALRATIRKHSMLAEGETVLVGLSGGPDSVCLLYCLHSLRNELSISLSAAYIDHGFRPGETPAEISFCSRLCDSMEIPFFTRAIDVTSFYHDRKMNKQEAARELRYQALRAIASEAGASRIGLGHNADDQAETVIMRLIRGAGPSGLSGIPPVRGEIIRPLIETRREDIVAFLGEREITFMTDSSNLTDAYTRNRLRNRVIPELKGLGRDITGTICRTAGIIREEERYFDIIVTKTLMRLISRKNEKAIELFSAPLEAMDTVILRRVLRRALDETQSLRGIGFVHLEEIIHLIQSGLSGDRVHLPGGIRAVKGYSTLIITSEEPAKVSPLSFTPPERVLLREQSMVLTSKIIDISELGDLKTDRKRALVDADKLLFPLVVRGRDHGDSFFPLGFGKRKKLQDYFVDEKVPRDERDSIPLLVSDDRIVWVMGYRMDERFKVAKETERVLQFEIKPGTI
ncbi:MAG: tRNA lysidine(34) synthetase TilS [Nitrospirales bacterium]|nr:tRNA lysidine(34) synthetase TilS [Nitrospirales bacterium]